MGALLGRRLEGRLPGRWRLYDETADFQVLDAVGDERLNEDL
jgi:hypothetical protein